MAKRKVKRTAAKSPKPVVDPPVNSDIDRHRAFNDQELERGVAAVTAIGKAETERLLSRLRLLRSNFDKEQMEAPMLEFAKKNLPNMSLVRNEKYKWAFELKRKESGNQGVGRDSVSFSVDSVMNNMLKTAGFQGMEETSDSHTIGMTNAFRTPGDAGNNRMSFGMTPKTLRLPKKGEFLLSVRGSPLGVYKEENLEAINESACGSCEGSSQ